MDFKKQRPDSPFFFEKEQVISLRRLRRVAGMELPEPLQASWIDFQSKDAVFC